MGWGGGGVLPLKLSKNPHILQQLKGKRGREVTGQPSSYQRTLLLSSTVTGTDSSLLLHAHSPGCQLTHKSFHSRNSIEGLASDKTQEEKFIDLFI